MRDNAIREPDPLRFIRVHPRAATFLAGLPQSGQVGSLRSRFVRTPLEGRVRAKDGSIAPGQFVAQNGAAALNRVLKAQQSAGKGGDAHAGHSH